jgi:autonomous glycyl radical cofactor GrcA
MLVCIPNSVISVEYSVLGETVRWSSGVEQEPEQQVMQTDHLSNTSLKMVKMDNNVKSPAKRPYLR